MVREGDRKTFWATDYNYTFETSHKSNRRRDIVLVQGTEHVPYVMGTGEQVIKENALCGEVVCFLKISNLGDIVVPAGLDRDDSSIVGDPTYTFILLRWFEPDPNRTFERDPLHRPLCTGPLHINHCLWRYAQTRSCRLDLATRTGLPNQFFDRHKHMFGTTHTEQMNDFNMEKNAFYQLISPLNVLRTVCMCTFFYQPHQLQTVVCGWKL